MLKIEHAGMTITINGVYGYQIENKLAEDIKEKLDNEMIPIEEAEKQLKDLGNCYSYGYDELLDEKRDIEKQNKFARYLVSQISSIVYEIGQKPIKSKLEKAFEKIKSELDSTDFEYED